ncbi:MAG TPA: hypothetical protein EYN38_08725 [Flavobacteriales bacterium]|nr:hypothetical protein [Flavobacteriales bacterium]HIA13244.1 hypothetical protein [Flavobacteriales bacterium]HIO73167.1 hypothetical protein [Flavobacteriales bacterium]
MKIIGVILIVIGVVDLGLSWMGTDITYQFVGEFSAYTPWILMVAGGFLFRQGMSSDDTED